MCYYVVTQCKEEVPMSSVQRDLIEYHAQTAVAIQDFMLEGRPFKSKKKEHTVEEYEEFLESLRNNYHNGVKVMGWSG